MVVFVGISFNLIIIRVDRSNRRETTLQESGLPSYPLRFVQSGQARSRGLEVHISRDISQDVTDSDKHVDEDSLDKRAAHNWPSVV